MWYKIDIFRKVPSSKRILILACLSLFMLLGNNSLRADEPANTGVATAQWQDPRQERQIVHKKTPGKLFQKLVAKKMMRKAFAKEFDHDIGPGQQALLLFLTFVGMVILEIAIGLLFFVLVYADLVVLAFVTSIILTVGMFLLVLFLLHKIYPEMEFARRFGLTFLMLLGAGLALVIGVMIFV